MLCVQQFYCRVVISETVLLELSRKHLFWTQKRSHPLVDVGYLTKSGPLTLTLKPDKETLAIRTVDRDTTHNLTAAEFLRRVQSISVVNFQCHCKIARHCGSPVSSN